MRVQGFTLAKLIWTDADFEQMSWHDCRLHGVAFIDDFDPHLHELRLDIDYIFDWQERGFWISPATLVFETQSFHIDLPGPSGDWINAMERTGAGDSTEWRISLNTGGSIEVRASGFRQYIRRSPILVATPNQYLETTQRGGVSFDIATQQT